jgi:hypothetical protein
MLSAPRDMYGAGMFQLFYEELGMQRVCKILDVNERTVSAWVNEVVAVPKMAVLALYWESMYGRATIDVEHSNELRMLYGKIRSLEEELQKRGDVIAGLRQMQYGTANEPYFEELGQHHAYSSGAYEILLQTHDGSAHVPSQSESNAHTHAFAPGSSKLSALAKTETTPQRQKTRAVG